FALAEDRALELDAPDGVGLLVVAELAEGDADLGCPAFSVDRGVHVPYRVPRVVVVAVAARDRVAERARGSHPEGPGGEVVVIGIDRGLELIGFHGVVAARQARLDLAGFMIVEPGADVERVAPDEHAHLGALRSRLALLGIALGELRGGLRGPPRRLVE